MLKNYRFTKGNIYMTRNLTGFWKEEKQTPKPIEKAQKSKKPKRKKVSRRQILNVTIGNDFYNSKEWHRLRYRVLKKYEAKCMACGMSPKVHGIVIHIDHILPRSKYPELSLVFDNLQVLCESCNLGKSNKDETDWRPDDLDAELEIVYEAIRRQ